MKGSRRFTKVAAQQIRQLLADVRGADRPRQKVLRQRIRDLGFFISDYTGGPPGFTPGDFDELIASGRIEIT